VFELDPGDYAVTVKAFAGDEASPAAQGTSGAFTITAGQDAGAVTVTLAPALETGEGTLAFTLTYPENAALESFALTRLAGDESFDLAALGADGGIGMEGEIFSGTKTGIGAGYWLARVSLNNGKIYTGKSEVAHIYKGLTTELNWAFDDDDFVAIPVVSGADSGPGTLREALERANAAGGGTIFIDLPEGDRVIALTDPLPAIAANITIEGNGTTLTLTLTLSGAQFLHIDNSSGTPTVTLRRLHFKGGRGLHGAAIYNTGNLALESCVFSDNQILTALSGNVGKGIVYTTGALTVLGCTFYNNVSGSKGMIYVSQGAALPVKLMGNIFYANNFFNIMSATHSEVLSAASGGYNISDKTAELSGYTGATGDLFSVTGIAFPNNNAANSPSSGGSLNILTALPQGFPALYFNGTARDIPATAGAAQAATGDGHYLDYSVNNAAYGTVNADPAPATNGSCASGTTVTLTASPKSITGGNVTFSHWMVNGTKDEATGSEPLVLQMNGHKTVEAVFVFEAVPITVSDATDGAGSAENVTLRYALANVADGGVINLPAGQTITLTSPLPAIARSVTINGNGATLTQNGFTPGTTSQLLCINASGKTITISRLHFTGGRATRFFSMPWAVYSFISGWRGTWVNSCLSIKSVTLWTDRGL
jgi:hypothetical protein